MALMSNASADSRAVAKQSKGKDYLLCIGLKTNIQAWYLVIFFS